MKNKCGGLFLILASIITIGTAIAHLSCLYFGPECYASQMAPTFLIESAQNGTYLAPALNIFISSVFIVWGLYALSAAQLIRKLPFLNFVLYAIATICIIRGILPLQLWLRFPERVDDVSLYVGVVWMICGLFYLFGYRIRDDSSNTFSK